MNPIALNLSALQAMQSLLDGPEQVSQRALQVPQVVVEASNHIPALQERHLFSPGPVQVGQSLWQSEHFPVPVTTPYPLKVGATEY